MLTSQFAPLIDALEIFASAAVSPSLSTLNVNAAEKSTEIAGAAPSSKAAGATAKSAIPKSTVISESFAIARAESFAKPFLRPAP